MCCTGLDLHVQAPSTVTKLTAFSFLPLDISKEEGNGTKTAELFLSYLSAVETMICRFMYKMKVKLQIYVQNGSVSYKLRD